MIVFKKATIIGFFDQIKIGMAKGVVPFAKFLNSLSSKIMRE